jgi:hypothetical protein
MPVAGDAKWTLEQALKYCRDRSLDFGASGLAEPSIESMRRLIPGAYRELETTAQRYQTRAAKTANKIAQETYKNKHGQVEKRDDLIRRKVAKDVKRAEDVNTQLVELGRYVECMSTGSTFIPGPIKTLESALRKTFGDNKCIWTDNKDLARCTIAHEQPWGVASIAATVIRMCQPIYGMKLIKCTETKPVQPPTAGNPCNYSGWNFAVVFKGSKIPAEIQANTYAMMYGKMSRKEFTEVLLGGDDGEYERWERRMGFEGGLGHLFFEIAREKSSGNHLLPGTDAYAASQIGCWYNELCRVDDATRAAGAPECKDRYAKFCKELKTSMATLLVAKHEWKTHFKVFTQYPAWNV